jgi:ATP-dependent Clp endopeptidase proteolytic subunit ClpP
MAYESNRVMQLVTDTSDPEVARMTIYGDITAGAFVAFLTYAKRGSTKALDVAQAIAELPEACRAIEVHVNSYGGEVAEGVAIYNALRSSGREVTTVCDGFACSIASVVFMAGTRRVMRPASLLMLHDPWNRVQGNATQLRKAADDLEVVAELSKTAYLTGTKMDADELDAVMAAETWVSPEQAMEWGLATEVTDPVEGGRPEQSVGEAVIDALTHDTPEAAMARMLPVVEERISQRIAVALDSIREQLDAERAVYEAAITAGATPEQAGRAANQAAQVAQSGLIETEYQRLARQLKTE